ncbi:hypothetical protein HOL63_03870 [Candidatus Peregrinibacteria bacterium]|jgi:hypothetical protein|nr:hypothetical protein [Candidatus Peregrinibacteria bacterium]MBT5468950.1 hypothetical protein [Candidatus Peregrinibacteria bacterium]MBT7337638.1 hypothetical protein [Candidatus Peregrinibacteria bacterium]
MILRIFRQALLLGYIFLTICALSYTLGRKQVPGVKWPFVTHFYAMMAPFQNYTTSNAELVAEGYRNRTWERIDLTNYLPHSRGEIAIRTRMSSFNDKKSIYTAMAEKLQTMEAANGRVYSSIRIVWEKWPKSQYGFYEGHTPDDTTRSNVTQFNL